MIDINTQTQLSEYLKRIQHYKRISKPKEKELAEIIANSKGKAKDNAVKELVEGNLFLVVNMAIKRLNSGADIMDLIYEGNLALFEAARDYSCTHKSKAGFCTLASTYIKNALVNAKNRLIYLPHNFNHYAGLIARFETQNNRPITIKEISKICKVSVSRAREIKEGLSLYTFSVEALAPSGESDMWEEGNWEDVVGADDPSFARMILKLDLFKFIEQLSPEQKNIIKLYFDEALSEGEIGKKMGCSKQYISMLGHRAMRDLKSKIMRDWDKQHKTRTKVTSGKDTDRLRSTVKNWSKINKILTSEDKLNKPIYKEVLAHYLGKR